MYRELSMVGSLVAVGILAMGISVAPMTARAQVPWAQCTLQYNDSIALDALPNDAWNTFANAPWYSQVCGSSGVRIYTVPLGTSHYHLGFEDPSIGQCVMQSGAFGIGTQNNCSAPNPVWKYQDRTLTPHDAGAFVSVYGPKGKKFAVGNFEILGTVPAQVWYLDSNNQWWVWDSLDPGYWYLGVTNIKQLKFAAAAGQSAPATFDWIDIGMIN